jgi:hypothetical protein
MMTSVDLQRFKERLLERYDADYLVDVLDISAEEVLDAFELKLIQAQNNDVFAELDDPE